MVRSFCCVIVLASCLWLAGCDWVAPEQPRPAFIQIDTFNYKSTRIQDVTAQRINYVWVLANNKTIGAFPLPAQVPLLLQGPTNIELLPGVYTDGVLSSKMPFPFFESHKIEVDLKELQKTNIEATTNLVDDAAQSFAFFENFENSQINLTVFGNRYQITNQQTKHVFNKDGSRSGLVQLPDTFSTVIDVGSKQWFKLPINRTDVFLEMHYKSNLFFWAGVFDANGTQHTDMLVAPSADWNKIYIELTDQVNDPNITEDDFKLFFQVTGNPELGQPQFWAVDNIRILHY